MKKITTCVLLAALAIASCQKNDPPANSGSASVYIPTPDAAGLKIDGTLFPGTSIEKEITESYMNLNYGYSQNEDQFIVELYVNKNMAAGNYTLQAGVNAMPDIRYFDSTGYYFSSSGTMSITLNDTVHHVMKGAFEGTVLLNTTGAAHQVTDGTFVINY